MPSANNVPPDSVGNSTFGVISLSDAVDTAVRVEFPMRKGEHTLQITADDFDTADSAAAPQISLIPAADTAETVAALADSAETEVREEKSAFAEFDEQVFRINYTKIGDVENGWMFWGLLGSFVLYCITKRTFYKQNRQLFATVFNYNLAQKEYDKLWGKSQIPTVVFQVLFSFVGGLFLFFAAKTYSGIETTTYQDVFCSIGLALTILLLYELKKHLFYVLATVFDRVEYAREYIFNMYLFNHLMGVSLFPVVVALAYMDPSVLCPKTLLAIGYVVVGCVFVLRLYREFQISRKNQVSSFYIFLYFCTLEILPLMLLVKVVSSLIIPELKAL